MGNISTRRPMTPTPTPRPGAAGGRMTAWDALCCWLLIPVAWGWRQVERRAEQIQRVWEDA